MLSGRSPHPSGDGSPALPESAADDGLLARLLTRWLFRPVQVRENRRVANSLHWISLEKLGPGLSTRTYTPIDWDGGLGWTRVLAHALAAGPGSEWVRRARPGDPVQVFGPRRPLPLARWDAARSVLAGDETGIGLAAAWRPGRTVLEVGDPGATLPVAQGLGVAARVVQRQPAQRPTRLQCSTNC